MSRRLLLVITGTLLAVGLIVLTGVGIGTYLLRNQAGQSQLLLVGDDRRLRLLGAGSEEQVLATDASTDLFRYPVPAPDGRSLAYISGDGADATLHVLDLGSGQQRELYRGAGSPPMYLNWSPDGRYLSFLVNNKGGGLHTYVVPTDGSAVAEMIAPDSPSYFVWSPDSSTLLLHLGGSVAEGGRVLTYQPGGQPQTILSDPGLFFRTPAWSVDGLGLFYVAQAPVEGQFSEEKVESVLMRAGPDGGSPTALVREPRALLFLGRSPRSDSLAYLKLSPTERALYFWDGQGGTARLLSKPDQAVTEFFWAPDGRTIAYLSQVDTPGSASTRSRRWHVVDTTSGVVRDFDAFTPSESFESILGFFDAYAASFSLWNADSTRLAYGTDDGVYVLDIKRGTQERVGDGVLGMWVSGH